MYPPGKWKAVLFTGGTSCRQRVLLILLSVRRSDSQLSAHKNRTSQGLCKNSPRYTQSQTHTGEVDNCRFTCCGDAVELYHRFSFPKCACECRASRARDYSRERERERVNHLLVFQRCVETPCSAPAAADLLLARAAPRDRLCERLLLDGGSV